MLKDIPICQDLLKILCGMVSDITFVRLTNLSKEMNKYKQIVPLKNKYSFTIPLFPNFRYIINKISYKNSHMNKSLIKDTIKKIELKKVKGFLDDLPNNIIKLKLSSNDFDEIPANIVSLSLKGCLGKFNYKENIIKLKMENTTKITNFPSKLLYLKFVVFNNDEEYQFNYNDKIESYFPQTLPDTLQCLIFTCYRDRYFDFNISFSKNLKKLALHRVNIRKGETLVLPDTLESLHLTINGCNKKIKNIPKSLKQLYLNNCNPFEDLTDSDKLKYFAYEGYDTSFPILPNCVEEIDITGLITTADNPKKQLPKSLKKVYISQYVKIPQGYNGAIIEQDEPKWYKSFF